MMKMMLPVRRSFLLALNRGLSLQGLLGLVLACVLLSGCQNLDAIHQFGKQQDEASRQYAQDVVGFFTQTCDPEVIGANATETLLTRQPLETLVPLCHQAEQNLGLLQEVTVLQGKTDLNITPQGKRVTGHYELKARYALGHANITMDLRQTGLDWQVDNLTVTPDVPFAPLQTEPVVMRDETLPSTGAPQPPTAADAEEVPVQYD
ncbi:MAG: hypothetical protein SFZ03_09190 [Candidatus Melainabacteria bacterium]|nr:hypothetical protein [Candidatus Melainabacteria bacterium]